jgi:hypothetical protein
MRVGEYDYRGSTADLAVLVRAEGRIGEAEPFGIRSEHRRRQPRHGCRRRQMPDVLDA